jgi:hypothetical protein
MISASTWDREWSVLEARWTEKPVEMQARYYEFLNDVFDTDQEFVEACAAVFVSREFFPAPMDFLMVRAGADYFEVMKALPNVSAAMSKEQYNRALDRVSPLGRRVLKQMGGSRMMGESRSDWNRLRSQWLECYAMTIQEEARSLPHVKRRIHGSEADRDKAIGWGPKADGLVTVGEVGRGLRAVAAEIAPEGEDVPAAEDG